MTDLIKQLTTDLQQKIDAFQPKLGIRNVGQVVEAGDGIAQVEGLAEVQSQELVEFDNGVMGIAFNLEKERVGVTIVGDYTTIVEGMQVKTTGRIASVPVGDGLVGRVVNALGEPIDGKGPIQFSHFRPIERIAPGVVERQDVDSPVQTGLKAIDAMTRTDRKKLKLRGAFAVSRYSIMSLRQYGTKRISRTPRNEPIRDQTKEPMKGWVE